MTSNVKMILDEVNARIKLAEAKMAEDPSNFDSFPGAENDKKVPETMKEPDPEVKDEGPASRTEATGAEPGSDAPVEQDHLYEADEPVLTPTKKPAETADANAKEASANPDVTKVASDILSIIRNGMGKKASCNTKECEKKMEKKEECGKKATCVKTEGCKKASDEHKMDLGERILSKIAAARASADEQLDAESLIKAAEEYNRGAADAKLLIQKIAQALEEQAAQEVPAAEAAPEATGAADAEAAIADAAASEQGAEDPVTPEEVVQAVSELVDEGQISQEEAAEVIGQLGATGGSPEGEVTEDDIAEGIAEAIASGEITEDEAQQLVQELVSAGADESVAQEVADAGAQAPAEQTPEEAGAADAEAAIADAAEAEKAASARGPMTLVDKINASLQKRAAAQAPTAQEKVAACIQKKAAERLQKQAEDEQVARYQQGFIQKCAEYNCDPQKVAQYIQARLAGAR